MRRLLCPKCGEIKPTPFEDAARGLFPRRANGLAIGNYCCDVCGGEIAKGTKVFAESLPNDMGVWEHDYLVIENPQEAFRG